MEEAMDSHLNVNSNARTPSVEAGMLEKPELHSASRIPMTFPRSNGGDKAGHPPRSTSMFSKPRNGESVLVEAAMEWFLAQ